MAIKIKSSFPPMMHQGRLSCRLCEASKSTQAEIKFDQGTVEPAEDDTLTGASSGATGVVDEVELVSGTWAGGDAAGFITMTSPTGFDSDNHWGTDGERATTPAGGSVYLDGDGTIKVYGLLYPESYLIERDGAHYCAPHYRMRFGPKDRDEAQFNVGEDYGH